MNPPNPDPLALLTPREKEVFRLIIEGFTSTEVASQLGISIRTAEAHRRSVKHKLGCTSTAALVHFAYKNGICKP